LLLLEAEIIESKKYGKIKTLLRILEAEDSDDSIIAAISLFRVFAKLMASGDLSNKPGENEELKKRYAQYKTILVVLLGVPEASGTIFTLCMRLLKVEGENLRQSQEHSMRDFFIQYTPRAKLSLLFANDFGTSRLTASQASPSSS
jgi:U3 small nucleolar RNA-associated protein 19